MQNDLSKRLFSFSINTINFLRTLPRSEEYSVIKYQLIKSATSAGANYEEAQAGTSRADFHNKVRISLKEMRESNYWLRILGEIIIGKIDKSVLVHLTEESLELNRILGSIVSKINDK